MSSLLEFSDASPTLFFIHAGSTDQLCLVSSHPRVDVNVLDRYPHAAV